MYKNLFFKLSQRNLFWAHYCVFLCVVQEWLDLRCRGVRNANAYILVYDICCVESFEYVKMIRQQIVENRYAHTYPLFCSYESNPWCAVF